ncbi:hypothetical protein MMC12_005451 [Toensbergia leucococca]|nr:hypothetical protein [Toensbergia leucococca]
MPYEIARPILIKLENPEQLRELEKASPQICGLDAEIWREFIKRDIPNWESKPHEPKNPVNWYKVYRKLRLESQREVDKDAEILKAAMEGIKTERAKHTSKVVDQKSMPRLPRMGMRAEGRARTTAGSSGNTSLLSFSSGSKTKTLTGKGVIDRARREAREMSLFSARNSLLATPTHKLNNQATHIHTAPRSLLQEHRQPAAPTYLDPNVKRTTIFAPRKRSAPSEVPGAGGTSNEGRDRRLKALTKPSIIAPSEERGVGGISNEERERRLKAFTNPRSVTQVPLPFTSGPQNRSILSPPSESISPASPRPEYKVPRSKPLSPDGKSIRPHKRPKPPVNPFMPNKKPRLS